MTLKKVIGIMKKLNTFEFTCLIIKEEDAYSSICLDLDIASEGINIKECKKYLIEAVNLYIESAIESNLPIIRPIHREDDPRNTRINDIVETFTIKIDLKVTAYA